MYGKLLGTSDSVASAYATFNALKDLRNGRVLERMRNMKERVKIKKETDKEKKIREEKIKAKKRAQEREERKLKEKKVVKSKVRK